MKRSTLFAGLTTALVLTSAMGGCSSSDRPPAASDPSFTPPGAGGSGGGFETDSGSAVPLCEKNADGSYCDCVEVPLFSDPPNLYFVLDRSGSMIDGSKWDQVRVTVAAVMRSLGPRANFGATVFPGYGNESCAAPLEIMSTRPGDPAGQDGPTTKFLLNSTLQTPGGGTPTGEALRYVLPKLQALGGKTFVILATDGGPNCNMNATCSVGECIPNIEAYPGCPPAGPSCCVGSNGEGANCLDSAATTSAVTSLRSAGFPVYVVGIPGSSAYANLLDNLATAGGTAQTGSTKYYQVTNTGSDALLSTLKKVAAKIVATCEYKLTTTPKDPNLVNVYLDEVVLPRDATNGWKIEGDTVTLLGSACNRVMAGDVLSVRIIAGCPTVAPN